MASSRLPIFTIQTTQMTNVLNLVNPGKSNIHYKISRFPDGQQQVQIQEKEIRFSERSHVEIRARLNNFLDLELIICATKSLRNLGVENIHLYVPYFLGSRSDRKFEDGGNNYLKDVICPIINNLHFKSVTVMDPHSDSLECCLWNYKKLDNSELVQSAIQNIWDSNVASGYYKVAISGGRIKNYTVLVAPDAGASKKIEKLAESINYKGDIIVCSKNRDTKGRLTQTHVPIVDDGTPKDFIIVDDICDGGRTFINIAEKIDEYFASEDFDGYKPKKYLVVTHGIFSQGFSELKKYFDAIYCTNSYSEPIDRMKVGDVLDKGFLNSFNVF